MEDLNQLLIKANQCFSFNQNEEAIEYFQKALEISPDDPDTYFNMGLAYQNMENYQDALNSFKKAAQIKPDDAEIYDVMGNIYDILQKYKESSLCYKKAIQIDPKNYKFFNNLGAVYFELNEYDNAISAYKKSLNLYKRDPDTFYNMANSYVQLKNYEKAKNCFITAIKLDNSNPIYHNNLGLAYEELKEFEMAIEQFHRAILVDATYSSPYNNMGNLFKGQKKYKEAINSYQKAIEIDQFQEYYFNLAQVYKIDKQYNEAIDNFKYAIQFDQQNAFLINALGAVYLENQMGKEAVDQFNQAIKQNKEIVQFQINRAKAHLLLNNDNLAIMDLDEIFKKAPSMKENQFISQTNIDYFLRCQLKLRLEIFQSIQNVQEIYDKIQNGLKNSEAVHIKQKLQIICQDKSQILKLFLNEIAEEISNHNQLENDDVIKKLQELIKQVKQKLDFYLKLVQQNYENDIDKSIDLKDGSVFQNVDSQILNTLKTNQDNNKKQNEADQAITFAQLTLKKQGTLNQSIVSIKKSMNQSNMSLNMSVNNSILKQSKLLRIKTEQNNEVVQNTILENNSKIIFNDVKNSNQQSKYQSKQQVNQSKQQIEVNNANELNQSKQQDNFNTKQNNNQQNEQQNVQQNVQQNDQQKQIDQQFNSKQGQNDNQNQFNSKQNNEQINSKQNQNNNDQQFNIKQNNNNQQFNSKQNIIENQNNNVQKFESNQDNFQKFNSKQDNNNQFNSKQDNNQQFNSKQNQNQFNSKQDNNQQFNSKQNNNNNQNQFNSKQNDEQFNSKQVQQQNIILNNGDYNTLQKQKYSSKQAQKLPVQQVNDISPRNKKSLRIEINTNLDNQNLNLSQLSPILKQNKENSIFIDPSNTPNKQKLPSSPTKIITESQFLDLKSPITETSQIINQNYNQKMNQEIMAKKANFLKNSQVVKNHNQQLEMSKIEMKDFVTINDLSHSILNDYAITNNNIKSVILQLKQKNSLLYQYFIDLFWVLQTYFGTYRYAFKQNKLQKLQDSAQSYMKECIESNSNIFKNITVKETALFGIEKSLTTFWNGYQFIDEQQKLDIINSIIDAKFKYQKNLQNYIAQICIQITLAREHEFQHDSISSQISLSHFPKQTQEIISDIFKNKDEFNDIKQLVIQDSLSIIIFCYQNFASINEDQRSFFMYFQIRINNQYLDTFLNQELRSKRETILCGANKEACGQGEQCCIM